MKNYMNSVLFIVFLIASIGLLLAACQSDDTESRSATDAPPSTSQVAESKHPDATAKPVTLKVMNGLFNEQDWQRIMVEPMKKRFPHLTLDQGSGVVPTYNLDFLNETIAGGDVPDVVLSGVVQSMLLVPLGLGQELEPFIKSRSVDLSRYDQVVNDTLGVYSSLFDMKTAMLPLYINFKVMLYNKDLFDKFGVDYPVNHMTHDELIELSKQLTRVDGGIQYYGYVGDIFTDLGGQYSLSYIDSQNKVNLSGLDKVFTLLKKAQSIPGMEGVGYSQSGTKFKTDKTLAMYNDWITSVLLNMDIYETMNWGMTTYPEFADSRYQTEVDFHSAYVTKTTKHPEEAFNVILYMMESEEIQNLITRSGKVSVHTNSEIRSQWGKDAGIDSEEAIAAIMETKMAPPRQPHKLDRTVIGPLVTLEQRYLIENADLNEVLRIAEEEMQKLVNEELGL